MRIKHISYALLLVTLFSSFFLTYTAEALTLTPIRFEVSGNPGEVLTQEMTLINERDVAQTYYSSFANFEARGETGSPTFVDPTEGLGTWMVAEGSVVLAPGASKIVPVQIAIPKNAEPGGHFAAIFWGTNPKPKPGELAIGAKTGILVLLRVNGKVSEQGGLLEFGVKGNKKFFTSLPVDFFYRFQNAGGDRIKPEGDVVLRNMFWIKSSIVPANPVEGNILPKSVRRFETTWQSKNGVDKILDTEDETFWQAVSREWKHFAFGYYKAKLSLEYGVNKQKVESSVGLWVFPWQLTIVVLIVFLIVFFVGRTGLRRYNKWVIGQAEEMLKREQEKSQIK